MLSKEIKWRQIAPATESPSPRFGHSVSRIEKSWILFGGISKNEAEKKFITNNELF